MRLNEINGQNQVDLDSVAQATVAYIRKHCRPWLSQSGGNYAVRMLELHNRDKHIPVEILANLDENTIAAMNQSPQDTVFTRPVRQDRRPKDSTRLQHQMFNTLLAAAGSVANRSNSAFASGEAMYESGESFDRGGVFIYFPIGEFHYAWSGHWYDWTMRLSLETLFQVDIHRFPGSLELIRQKYGDRYNPNKIVDSHLELQRVLQAIFRSESFANTLFNDVDVWKPLAQKAIHVDVGLPTALTEFKRNEIMIHSSHGLYIRARFFDSHVKPLLEGSSQ